MLEVLDLVTCTGLGGNIDKIVPDTVKAVVTLIKIAVPILLVIFGMVDLGKAVMSNDEKEMKSAQTRLIKRILYAVLIFFIIAIVQWIFGVLDNNGNSTKTASCFNCFINGNCSSPDGVEE